MAFKYLLAELEKAHYVLDWKKPHMAYVHLLLRYNL